MSQSIAQTNIKIKKVETLQEFIDAIRLRVNVFILEQHFQPGWEPDEDDKISNHYIVLLNHNVVSTARVRETNPGEFKIERMVTQKERRGQQVGKALLLHIINELLKNKPKRIWLRSQVQSQKFYEKCNFNPTSKPFDMWNVPHIDMDYPLNDS